MNHEDKSNKIEMLRKIESKLWYMAEKRDYIASMPTVSQMDICKNGQDLEAIEVFFDKERKDTKRRRAQEKADAMADEKQMKNDLKKLKQ